MWDSEVDIACIGAGIGGLANAIAAVDAGGEVLVADAAPADLRDAAVGSLRERVQTKRGWLVQDTLDAETDDYFAAITEGLVVRSDLPADESVHLRDARNLTREEAYGRVLEPFVGSRLVDWAAQCVASPFGLLYTSMRGWRTTSMRSADGESIEVFSVGAMQWHDGDDAQDLRRWMSQQARERDIEVQTASRLQRLVFEDGVIVGVVLSTPEGPRAVRTRAGVTFAPRDEDPVLDSAAANSGDRLQVCLVGRTASRFGRVELLATEPTAPPRPTCTGSRRQYRDGMHESRQPSEGWRCGNVHGYSPFGE